MINIKKDSFDTFWIRKGEELIAVATPRDPLHEAFTEIYKWQHALEHIELICDDYPDNKLAKRIWEEINDHR